MGKQIGARFARKNVKDRELYQAEALFILTVICKDEKERFLNETPITDIHLLTRRVYRELYKYMYADRAVSASRMTVWRNERDDKHVVTTSSLTETEPMITPLKQISLEDKRCTEIELLEVFDDVARSTQEREYLQMKMQGADEEEIANHLKVCTRVVQGMRARIAKRLKRRY